LLFFDDAKQGPFDSETWGFVLAQLGLLQRLTYTFFVNLKKIIDQTRSQQGARNRTKF
jgi:ABC-type lipoprotein export system ATPase subunit